MVRAVSGKMIMDLNEQRQRAIRLWLYAVAALIFAMVLVGGATRLTESGLSIVEWKPVTGTLPPLSEAAWQAEFDKYKTIPQFRHLNSGMTLARVQDHLLVGMDASADGPADRRRVPAAVPVVSDEGLDCSRPALAALGDLRARRAARWRRLVDGGVWPRRPRRGLAVSARDPSDPGVRDLCGDSLDRRGDARAPGHRGAAAHPRDSLCIARSGAAADLSRRAGRRFARGTDLQHLAADRRQLHSRCGAARA